jgi:hypothetical protein
MNGSHFNLHDSHHTTIDVNPTSSHDNTICGHGSISTHPFESNSMSNFSTTLNVDGCITSGNDGSFHMTGPGGFGEPTVSIGIGFGF